MNHVAVVGCGVVGAAIAYELSQIPGLSITVLDQQPPAQAATGAALGVLMGIISRKTEGKGWQRRQASIKRYETLIPELEAMTGHTVPYNRQGILMLRFNHDDLSDWQHLVEVRREQGWHLELWQPDELQTRCPQIANSRIVGAVYSPSDRQVDPTALTLSLVDAATRQGVTFQFGTTVTGLASDSYQSHECGTLRTSAGPLAVDWVVLAAGLGTPLLAQTGGTSMDIRPVLGQAMRVKLPEPLGDRQFQPAMTGEDIHIVPLGDGEYWVGATVEFPTSADLSANQISADPDRLKQVWQGAIALCPALQTANVLKTWSGLRPRPQNRSAPVIERLTGYSNVLVATGHYRNGILLAPATAQEVRALLGY